MNAKKIKDVKDAVHSKVSEPTVKEMIKLAKDADLVLWGEDKPRNFLPDMVYMTLFKDLQHVPYAKLEEVDMGNFRLGHNSYRHNVHEVRRVLKSWGKGYIYPGQPYEWKMAAKNANLPEPLQSVNLWMDSTDVSIEHSKERGPKSEFWSGKNQHPAWRYMTICDGKGRIRKVWLGYTPKLYDSHFLQANRETIEDLFRGGHIIADNHFESGGKEFRDPKFYCNPKETKKRKRDDEDDEDDEDAPVVPLVKKKKTLSEKIQKSRGRVEQKYADIYNRFATFDHPWAESLEQLDCLMFYAIGIHNKNVR